MQNFMMRPIRDIRGLKKDLNSAGSVGSKTPIIWALQPRQHHLHHPHQKNDTAHENLILGYPSAMGNASNIFQPWLRTVAVPGSSVNEQPPGGRVAQSSHPTHGSLYLDLEGWKYKPSMARRRSPAWNVSLAGC